MSVRLPFSVPRQKYNMCIRKDDTGQKMVPKSGWILCRFRYARIQAHCMQLMMKETKRLVRFVAILLISFVAICVRCARFEPRFALCWLEYNGVLEYTAMVSITSYRRYFAAEHWLAFMKG